MGHIFKHPGQPNMQVEVILASRHFSGGPNIYTIRMRYPRIIHPENMTHRVLGRNARSSRAVPVKRMIEEVKNDPFIPWHWGKNQKGMQADEECNESVRSPHGYTVDRKMAWIIACQNAVASASGFMDAGYHKQVVNRLLEPFMWIDVLITATEWSNFLWLRDHKDAEPHLRDLAKLTKTAIKATSPQFLEHGGWHLPYITKDDYEWAYATISERDRVAVPDRQERAKLLCKISAARCARISYAPFDGDASYERELERYNLLVTSDRVHASPLEHQASPDAREHYYRCPELSDGTVDHGNAALIEDWVFPHLHGNLTGWIQARKLVPNEAYHGEIE